MSGTVRVVQFNLIKSRVSTGVECPRLFVQCLTESFLGKIEVNCYKTIKNYLYFNPNLKKKSCKTKAIPVNYSRNHQRSAVVQCHKHAIWPLEAIDSEIM